MKAVVEFPLNVKKVTTEDGTQYLAENVYSLETVNTPQLEQRIKDNFNMWLERAKADEPVQPTTIDDVVEALNALTEFVIGGE